MKRKYEVKSQKLKVKSHMRSPKGFPSVSERYPLGQFNIIEILWRFIKYKCLKTEDDQSYSTLVEAVENILVNFGTKYTRYCRSHMKQKRAIW